jgi:hypothetical protein
MRSSLRFSGFDTFLPPKSLQQKRRLPRKHYMKRRAQLFREAPGIRARLRDEDYYFIERI